MRHVISEHRTSSRGRRLLLTSALAAAAALVSSLPAGPPARAAAAAAPVPSRPTTAAEARTAAWLDAHQGRTGAAGRFFKELPKGGDLHNHLSGAVKTEYLIKLAADDGLCIDATMTAVAPPCGPGKRPAADALTDAAFRQRIVRAWSMQDFPQGESGHDHFFATFGKFGEATAHRGKMLADVAGTAAAQNQSYLETMVSPTSAGAKKLADEVGWHPDFATMHSKLLAGGRLDQLIADAKQEADDSDTEFRETAHCATATPSPACRITVRWISQVSRNSAPERVFTQIAVGLRLAERDQRFVAVNLVQPEDGEVSLRDYRLQMRMLDYLHGVYPRAHITLHAGELVPGLVKPEDLTFHINDAVRTGKAERIGHGVDLVHEDDWRRLARDMARRQVAVEVPLTSNAQILQVEGVEHPFPVYRSYGVPVVLSTDDPGVSRGDIGQEYQRAAHTYDLGYPDLKDLARASLEYSFLPGRSLWRTDPVRKGFRLVEECRVPQSDRCGRLLSKSPKAQLEWRQERAFQAFEARYAS
ncbi:adenosine deaminase [Streptomyces sp. NBC_01754]|uniref:adenosine deaminase family protein n=1 Tax=Streptomyces sp. NBC_01754 TaxID=2975930 RepID=UPI002DD8B389|nr:adenosine deaminase [Streptomyces sp. NBC_01754]WSC93898.1 adenosine deaminase [Streptomyces sp. NBC_01754]